VLAYEAAFAVRQIEVGLASLVSLLSGFTLTVFGLAVLFSTRYPAWLGGFGLLGGVGTVAAGAALAFTGFSAFAMTLSMLASVVLLIWAVLVGILMWRLAPQLVGCAPLREGGARRVELPMLFPPLGVDLVGPASAPSRSNAKQAPLRARALRRRS
jgi:hypothetical protein